MYMISYYQTTLSLQMASTICTLINLICVIPLYLKLGLAMRSKTFGLLFPTFQERRTMMQMQNHVKNKLNWNGCLTKKCLQKLFLTQCPSTSCKEQTTPSSQQAESGSLHNIRQKSGATSLSAESLKIIQQSRCPSTTKRCGSYIEK